MVSFIIQKEKICILKIFILVILFFGINIYMNFATDTYPTFSIGFRDAAWDMIIRNGRPVVALLYALYYISGLPNVYFYYLSTILALLFLGVSIWIFQKILEKYGIKENIRIVLSFISIANVFIIEYFMFIEKSGFMLAILLNIVGIYLINLFFEQGVKKYYIFSIIAIIFAIFTYQGTIALFAILSVPFAFKRAKDFRDYFLKILAIGVAYGIPIVIDIVTLKMVFKSARIAEKVDYISNAKNLLSGLAYNSTMTFDVLPKYFFQIIILVVLLATIILIIINRANILFGIINLLVIVSAAFILSAASIFQGSGWWAMRVVYPMASVVGALAINLYMNYRMAESSKARSLAKRMVTFAIGFLLTIQYFSFNRIYIDKYKLNALDEYRYNYIGQAIDDYQENTGIEIKKIAFYSDAEKIYPPYPNLYCQGDLVVSAFYTDWSDIKALNYYLGCNYEKIDPLDEYVTYFAERNWDRLSSNQLLFEKDTLHICIY